MTEAELRALLKAEFSAALRGGRPMAIPSAGGGKSLGDQVVNSAAFQRFVETKQRQSDDIELKAGGAFSAMFGTPTTVEPITFPERALRVRDLFTETAIGTPAVVYARVTGFSNNAAPVAEGSLKPEVTMVSTAVTKKMAKVAAFATFTREVLDDVPGFRAFVDRVLAALLLDAEDAALATGATEGLIGMENLPGTQSQAFSINALDTVRKAMTLLETENFKATGILMPPAAWEATELLKDSSQRYQLYPSDTSPRAALGRSLWGVPVIVSAACPANRAFVGDFSRANLWSYQGITLRLTDSYSDYFRYNVVAAIVEERIMMDFYQPKALVKAALA